MTWSKPFVGKKECLRQTNPRLSFSSLFFPILFNHRVRQIQNKKAIQRMALNARLIFYQPLKSIGVPNRIRTGVAGVKGRCPWPD